jgi:hypothetical protein
MMLCRALVEGQTNMHSQAEQVQAQAVETATREKFAQVAAVNAIYQDELDDEIVIWVFIGNEKYDDALMDTLLSLEESVLDAFPDARISFSYVPSILCNEPREVVGSTARLIFNPRVFDLHPGAIEIGDDFTAPLPDDFWLGEE